MDQLQLDDVPPPRTDYRVQALASFLAGIKWPGGEHKLTKAQKQAAMTAAQTALERLDYEVEKDG